MSNNSNPILPVSSNRAREPRPQRTPMLHKLLRKFGSGSNASLGRQSNAARPPVYLPTGISSDTYFQNAPCMPLAPVKNEDTRAHHALKGASGEGEHGPAETKPPSVMPFDDFVNAIPVHPLPLASAPDTAHQPTVSLAPKHFDDVTTGPDEFCSFLSAPAVRSETCDGDMKLLSTSSPKPMLARKGFRDTGHPSAHDGGRAFSQAPCAGTEQAMCGTEHALLGLLVLALVPIARDSCKGRTDGRVGSSTRGHRTSASIGRSSADMTSTIRSPPLTPTAMHEDIGANVDGISVSTPRNVALMKCDETAEPSAQRMTALREAMDRTRRMRDDLVMRKMTRESAAVKRDAETKASGSTPLATDGIAREEVDPRPSATRRDDSRTIAAGSSAAASNTAGAPSCNAAQMTSAQRTCTTRKALEKIKSIRQRADTALKKLNTRRSTTDSSATRTPNARRRLKRV